MRQKIAVFVHHGEVTLMFFHRGDDGFFGNTEIFFLKGTHQSGGIFEEVNDFVEKIFIFFHADVVGGLNGFDLFFDHGTTFFGIDHNIVFTELVDVAFGAFDDHIPGTVEAVRTGDVAAFHIDDLYGNHFVAEKSHDPMDGTDEAEFVIAPTHRFGEFETQYGVDQKFGEDFDGVFAFFFFGSEYVFAAFDFFHGEVGFGKTFGTKEALQCFGGIAFGIECRFFGRTFEFFFEIRLFFGKTVHKEGQTTGRTHTANILKIKTRLKQRFFCHFYEVSDTACHKTGRNLFDTDLKQ